MDIKKILTSVDHTLLKQTATKEQIEKVCQEAIDYSCASVCIPPYFVKAINERFGASLNICTVIGFPAGYSTKNIKYQETLQAVSDGANEIDMVLNINMLKDQLYDDILEEINLVKEAAGERILKVIIESCLLTQEEKIKMCSIISKSNADYIKTSTGFSSGGATLEDVMLFRQHLDSSKKIKAAGGIRSLEDAEAFLKAGADRLGTSSIVKIIKEEKLSDY